MDLKDNKFKQNLLLIVIGVCLFVGLTHLEAVGNVMSYVIGLWMPLIIGGSIAFILNVPMCFFEKHYDKIAKNNRKLMRLKTPVCIVATLIAFVLVLVFIGGVVFPNIAESIKSIARIVYESYPKWFATLESWGIDTELIRNAMPDINPGKIAAMVKDGSILLLNTAVAATSGVFGVFSSALFGIIIALYILASKKTLGLQAKKITYAYLKKEWADEACEVASLTYRTFANFLSGQCLEAVILSLMFFVVLFVGGFPYAGTIAVLIGSCSLIPFIGAFIGCFFGALMIAVVSLKKMLIFIVVFLIVQQIEGQIVYPRVVGGSVGLPALWTLLAVLIGGNVSGIIGVIVFIPIFSVIYALLRRNVYERLEKKKIAVK